MQVQVVRNVEIYPKYKSIYIPPPRRGQNSFTFKIKEGSGYFSVKINDTDIADFVVRDTDVTIVPKREGGLKISVEDIEVPDAKIAHSELLISDIYWLDLKTNATLLEQGGMIDLNVTAFDSRHDYFDLEQYEMMWFDIEIEKSGVMRDIGLEARGIPEFKRKFLGIGHNPGKF
jgi:hypothetical protein